MTTNMKTFTKKKFIIYLFPILIYLLSQIALNNVLPIWWNDKNFDDVFYTIVNLIIVLNVIIIYFWELKVINNQLLSLKGFKLQHLFLALLIGLTVFIFNLNSSKWFSLPITENTNTLDTILSYSNGRFVLNGFLIWNVLLGPIREELIDRMLLMDTYFKKSPYYLDVVVSAVVFSLQHLLAGWSGQAFMIYLIPGVLYALIYRFTGKIHWSILIHILWNGYVYYDLLCLVLS
ncbi:CAAX amino terminal protease self- immunity [Streptococcus parauberis]|uniref:CAAX amino terminal protease self-immunity n=1 Tax=Streptococcus parauberis TaxID=1348 RepID=A0A854WP42_9STRE|nr:type II CAAX endopeptidase family protein [Streptococcus parauberis]PCH13629.1 CAAX amino terminal protease self- immunity [Streptococcus parauberis]